MNEAELAERCGKGDNLARKQLYERYAGQLMAICIRYIGDRETAQDVLHDGLFEYLSFFRQVYLQRRRVTQSMACACDGK